MARGRSKDDKKPAGRKNPVGRPPILTLVAVSYALGDRKGNLAAVARDLRVARNAVVEFIEKHPEIQQVIDNIAESHIDEAERQLQRKIEGGSLPAITFFLKTKGRHRGYVEDQTVKVTGEATLIIKRVIVNRGDNRKDS